MTKKNVLLDVYLLTSWHVLINFLAFGSAWFWSNYKTFLCHILIVWPSIIFCKSSGSLPNRATYSFPHIGNLLAKPTKTRLGWKTFQWGASTLSITKFSIMTLSTLTLLLCWVPFCRVTFMLSVANKPLILSVVMHAECRNIECRSAVYDAV